MTDPPAEVLEKDGRLVLLCSTCAETTAHMKSKDEVTRLEEFEKKLDHIIASTGDIRREYEILDIIHVYVEPFDVNRAVLSLKEKAFRLGGDGVIFIEFDTVVYQVRMPHTGSGLMQSQLASKDRIGLSAYGTAVRFV